MSAKPSYYSSGKRSEVSAEPDRPVALALSDVSSLADRPLYLHEDELHRPLSAHREERWGAGGGAEGEEGEDADYELSRHDLLERLRMIHSPAQLVIDLSEALSVKRPGFDVAVFESQSFRCRAADESGYSEEALLRWPLAQSLAALRGAQARATPEELMRLMGEFVDAATAKELMRAAIGHRASAPN